MLMLNKLRLRLFRQEIRYYSQLLNEAGYHLKNYGDRGGCSASAVNTMINFLRMTKLQLRMK